MQIKEAIKIVKCFLSPPSSLPSRWMQKPMMNAVIITNTIPGVKMIH